jgi:hypothetical protein
MDWLAMIILGVGRDDGKDKGEFSAIFMIPKLKKLQGNTFWLSETPINLLKC